ncbi:MAG: hypothetical protein MHM6MM_008960 [Cercozoa sp. M6MM]
MSGQTYASTFAENGLRDVSSALVQSAAIRDTGLEKGLSSLGESLRAGVNEASVNARAAVSDAVSKIVAGAIVVALIWGACKYYEIKSRQNRRSPPEDRS